VLDPALLLEDALHRHKEHVDWVVRRAAYEKDRDSVKHAELLECLEHWAVKIEHLFTNAAVYAAECGIDLTAKIQELKDNL
jgi:hypothetical protein